MNSRIPFFALCVVLVSPGFAVEKKSKKKGGSTVPPISPMLMISASPENTVDPINSAGLITTNLGGRDLDFFESLLGTGQLQVLLGELVKTRAESPQVKSVGTALASAQAEENRQINRLASLNGLTLSAAVAGAQRQTSAELEKLSGTSFDIACVSKIVEANQQTVQAYEEGAESKNPEIQGFASQMLPIARERLRIAEKMIEGPERPASAPATALATPTPRAPALQLRPTGPSPTKPAPAASPAAQSATPPPLTKTVAKASATPTPSPSSVPPSASDATTPSPSPAKQP